MSAASHVANASLGDTVGRLSMAELAYLHNHPEHEARKLVKTACSQGCGETFEAMALFAGITCCDACRAKADKADAMERAKKHWESICPPAFRDTDRAHPDFPKAQWDDLKGWNGDESLFLFGDSRAGKTRLAMLLLKRAMLRNQFVGVLWPEQLKAMKWSRETLEKIQHYGRYDVLLLDDALLTGAADESTASFLKDLLDYMMRYKKHVIVTSQIGGAEYEEHSDKFGNATKADKKRAEALVARLRESCRVIPFVKPVAVAGQTEHF
jgi:DNA replication protein DnaC